MALTAIEVVNLVSSVIKESFDGSKPAEVGPFVDKLNILKANVTDATNQAGLLSAIKAKLVGDARDAYPSQNTTIDSLIASIQRNCKGPTPETIQAELDTIRCHNKDKFKSEIKELTRKLKDAYITDGSTKEAAGRYAIKAATKVIKSNYPTDLMMASMNNHFDSVDDVLRTYEETCSDGKQQAQIRAFTATEKRGRPNNRSNFRSRGYQNNWRGNHNNNNRRFNNANDQNNPQDNNYRGRGNQQNQYRGSHQNNNRGGNNGNNNNNNYQNNNNNNRRNVRVVESEGQQEN
jgi:hypothetical protein